VLTAGESRRIRDDQAVILADRHLQLDLNRLSNCNVGTGHRPPDTETPLTDHCQACSAVAGLELFWVKFGLNAKGWNLSGLLRLSYSARLRGLEWCGANEPKRSQHGDRIWRCACVKSQGINLNTHQCRTLRGRRNPLTPHCNVGLGHSKTSATPKRAATSSASAHPKPSILANMAFGLHRVFV
jgi:hypothetical protein